MPHVNRPGRTCEAVLALLQGIPNRRKAAIAGRILNAADLTEEDLLAFWNVVRRDVASLIVNTGEKVHPEVY